MRVYFVRHGQTDANIRYDDYPWDTNISLNETGERQVHKTAAFLAATIGDEKPLIISSPLVRTQQTARIIADAWGADVKTDVRLQELHVGAWHSRDIASVYAYFMNLPPDERFTFVPPGGESWQQCGQRMAAVVTEHQADDLIIVSHSAPIQSAVGTILQTEYKAWTGYEIRNASVSLLQHDMREWQSEYIGRIFDPTAQLGLF